MRQFGIFIIVGILFFGFIGLGLYNMFRAIAGAIEDRGTRKELEELGRMSETKREDVRQRNEDRLNNGCEHQWGAMITDFPANACRKCGLEQKIPFGGCDHVWRVEMAAAPYGYCEKCDTKYARESILG